MSLLDVRSLRVQYVGARGTTTAVDGVDLSIDPGRIVGVVGESGCGKSTLARALLGLYDPRRTRTEGQVLFEGQDILRLKRRALDEIRGNRISMVFQNPQSSLNPVRTIGDQVAEAMRTHTRLTRRAQQSRVLELLDRVGIPDPARRANSFPHELSGGQQQRVSLAAALACSPALLIADEPTTALDVTIQAQVLALIRELSTEMSMSVLLISHDLTVIAELCSTAHVMYGGVIVEQGATADVLGNPQHPYTTALLGAAPRVDERRLMLQTIPGVVPTLASSPGHCRFVDRCAFAFDACRAEEPGLRTRSHHDSTSSARCWLPGGVTASPEKEILHV